jgi:hypothetical protein
MRIKKVFFLFMFCLLPLLPLEVAQLIFGREFSPLNSLLRLLFVATLLAAVVRLHRRADVWSQQNRGVHLLSLAALSLFALAYGLLTYSQSGALLGLWLFFLLIVSVSLAGGEPAWWKRLAVVALLIGVAGGAPPLIAQLEGRFSDEEFYVGVQAGLLSLFLLLLVVSGWWALTGAGVKSTQRRPTVLRPRYLFAGVLLGGLAGTPLVLQAYQTSFYTTSAPPYHNITSEQPFLCGALPATAGSASGVATFQSLLALLEQFPDKNTAEYGMLALGTQKAEWAQAFRTRLLAEMEQRRYTGPAHSVKAEQYVAALRLYYYVRVRQLLPDLFSEEERAQLDAWFAAINRRTWTVEWVDWLYALAFGLWPQGPYENQETGAGLLAALEANGLAAPELRAMNQDYLAHRRSGWAHRFRNTDDAYAYQFHWITNAYFQELWADSSDPTNRGRAFEWLLLQLLPDGTAPYYNHTITPSPAPLFYLGAILQQDPRFVWLAAQSLGQTTDTFSSIRAQPGVDQPLDLDGEAPTQGSCLLYGDSGLPNQLGPLAPDKIVFRDGWGDESAYLLLNLRFTGWHRYKATNTVAILYQGERIVADLMEAEPIQWLPVGRMLFRDKRIPRENLSGLVIENSGLSGALSRLTGIGSAWAQDPPPYAEVIEFQPGQIELGQPVDKSHTRVANWRGWRHDRWISFYPDGPIVIIDGAEGPPAQHAGLSWHLVKSEQTPISQGRVRVRAGDDPLVLQMLPLDDASSAASYQLQPVHDGATILYKAPQPGRLSVASLFLPGRWADAEVQVDYAAGQIILRDAQGTEELVVALPKP